MQELTPKRQAHKAESGAQQNVILSAVEGSLPGSRRRTVAGNSPEILSLRSGPPLLVLRSCHNWGCPPLCSGKGDHLGPGSPALWI